MPKQPSHLPLAIISVILSGIIFGLLGYWYGADVNSTTSTSTASPAVSASSSPVAAVSPAATATPDPTAGWKTYINHGVSIKYPATWQVSSVTNAPLGTTSIISPNGSTISWLPSMQGGGCSPTDQHGYFNAVGKIAGAKDLYVIESGSSSSEVTTIGVTGISNGVPTVGPSNCTSNYGLLYFELPDGSASAQLQTSKLSQADIPTIRLIMGSLTD